MKTIFDIFTFINWRANKEQNGRVFTPDNFNLAGQFTDYELMKLKYGLPEQYRPGMPLPAQAWEITQEITDALVHLKVYMGGRDNPQLKVDLNGFADKPIDYLHYSSLAYVVINNNCSDGEEVETRSPIEVVRDGDWDLRVSNILKKPTFDNPICRINNNYIEFRPKKLGFVDFTYLRKPIPAVLGYTINEETTNIEYDPSTSTQPDWPEQMFNEYANILYSWLSVNIQSQINIQDAQLRKTQGF